MQANGVQPSIVTYTALLGGYHAKGDVAGAWRVYKTILEVGLDGCQPRSHCVFRLGLCRTFAMATARQLPNVFRLFFLLLLCRQLNTNIL